MVSKGHALSRDALVRTLTAYSGITTEAGEEDGTTLVDSNLKGRNDFISEKTILIMSGDAKDEDKGAISVDTVEGKIVNGIITLQGTGFSAQIKAGTIFRVLNISSIEIDVARIEAKIDTIDGLVDAIEAKLDAQKGATGVFYEQASVALNVSVGNAEADLFDLSAASTRYIVRSLRVKCADPGAGETVTIRLYELINVTSTLIDSFVIDHDNFMTYFSLMDMFGVPQLAGDDLHVVAIGSVAGPVALTGRYSFAKTNV